MTGDELKLRAQVKFVALEAGSFWRSVAIRSVPSSCKDPGYLDHEISVLAMLDCEQIECNFFTIVHK